MASRTEMFPPKPKWTEKDIPDQHGRVFIVTGGSSGCGYEVSKALYNLNGRVYIAGRNASSAAEAIESIKSSPPAADQVVQRGKGELFFLKLDLADLSTIKASVEKFLGMEERLDVIWHNAGVMVPPAGSLTKQGHDMQLGTNVLGPFLFQQFLTPMSTHCQARRGHS
jgi:retinol dehydrogenase 12